jgi:hypothetical protein
MPNEFFRNEQYPQLIFAFITATPLNQANTITLDEKKEPVVTINREVPFKNSNKDVVALRELTKMAKKVFKDSLKINYLNDTDAVLGDDKFFKELELGGVAHELGTIPFSGSAAVRDPRATTPAACIDSDLKLRGHEGVYVCDLSIFPMSPEVNPTLTLAALALRLSRNELHPRELSKPSLPGLTDFGPGGEIPAEMIWVMNQTGEKIKIFIANNAGAPVTGDDKEMELGPGDDTTRIRKRGITESVAVYRLKYNNETEYVPVPKFWKATAGEFTAITDIF